MTEEKNQQENFNKQNLLEEDSDETLYKEKEHKRKAERHAQKITKIYFLKKKIHSIGIVSIFLVIFFIFLINYKTFSFLNYIIWFLLISNGVLGILWAYIVIKWFIEGVQIVSITDEYGIKKGKNNDHDMKDIFTK